MLLMSCVVSSDTLRLFRHVVRLIFVLFQPTVVQLAQLSSAEPVPVLLATVASLHVGSVASIAVLRPTCSSRLSTHGDALPLPLPPYYMGGPPMGPLGSGSPAVGLPASASTGLPAAAGAAPSATVSTSAPPLVPHQPRAPVVTSVGRPPRGSTPEGYFYDEDGVLTAIPVPNFGDSEEDDDDDDVQRAPSPLPPPVPGSRPDAFRGFKERAKPGTSAEQRLAAEWKRLLGVSPAEPGAEPWNKFQFKDTFKKWANELVFPVPQPNSALPPASQAKPFLVIQRQAAALGHAATANFTCLRPSTICSIQRSWITPPART